MFWDVYGLVGLISLVALVFVPLGILYEVVTGKLSLRELARDIGPLRLVVALGVVALLLWWVLD